jgi:hypothetical protein
MSTLRTATAVFAIAGVVAAAVLAGGMSASADSIPANDNFANAQLIVGNSVGVSVSDVNATTQPGERIVIDELHPDRVHNTVWLKWVAPASGAITISTQGSPSVTDTVLAVFTGTKLSNAKRIAVNNDASTGHFYSVISSLAVKKGTTYHIQTGSNGFVNQPQTGSIFVGLSGVFSPVKNDDKGFAIAEKGASWTSNSSTIGSSIEPVWESTTNPQFSGNPLQDSIWWKWTAPATGNATFSVQGHGSLSTYAQFFESSPQDGFIPAPGVFDNNPVNAKVTLTPTVFAGTTYYIRAGSTNSSQAAVTAKFSVVYTGPSVSKVSPAAGKLAGGTKITITGARLTGVTSVEFGGIAGSNLVHVNSKKITVVVPAGAAKGKVTVRLLGSTSHSAVTTASHYTYK